MLSGIRGAKTRRAGAGARLVKHGPHSGGDCSAAIANSHQETQPLHRGAALWDGDQECRGGDAGGGGHQLAPVIADGERPKSQWQARVCSGARADMASSITLLETR